MSSSRASPSDWAHRGCVTVMAAAGCGIAVYLSLYQVGWSAGVWGPIFGDGTGRVVRFRHLRRYGIRGDPHVLDRRLGTGGHRASDQLTDPI
ncbi:MAG TPA: hypothetical protein VFC51_04245 [Chloroflexota bacterium]|nr:hypothetical protein [Chloroflexota bacterium]